MSKLFHTGQTDRVQAYLEQGLKDAETEPDPDAVVSILNDMIGYYRSVSKFPEAIATAERAIREMKELGYEGSVPYGTTLLNAATAYRASGDKKTALGLFEEVVPIFREHLPEDDAHLAALYNNISACHEGAGEHTRAHEALQQALNILVRRGDMPMDEATVYTNLALNLFHLNRNEDAMETLQKAFHIFDTHKMGDGSRHDPHYASALAGLASAYYKMGNMTEAVSVYEKALAHLREFYGENSDYAITSKNCALAYEALGETEKAAAYRKRADTILARLGLRS